MYFMFIGINILFSGILELNGQFHPFVLKQIFATFNTR